MSVLDLVTKAGGFTDTALGTGVRVTRILPDGTTKVITLDVESLIKGKSDAKTNEREQRPSPGAGRHCLRPRADNLRSNRDPQWLTRKHTTAAGPAPMPDADDAVERRTLRDYYVILREHVWISLPIAIVVALGYFYTQARKTPIYEASASLQFEKPETVVTSQGVVDPSVRSDMDLNTYIHDINSNRLRSSVIQSFTPPERLILQRAAMKRLPPGLAPPAGRRAPRQRRRRAA